MHPLRQRPERRFPNAATPVRRRVVLAVAAFALVLGAACAQARGPDEAVGAGDEHYAAGRLELAVRYYMEAAQESPGRAAILCRLARAESELGETQKGDEQRRTWGSAVAHAREAVRAAPDSAGPHARLAVALGRQALREGPRTKLALSKEIKSEVDRALELDPGMGLAWHVLAVWNVKVASLNGMERLMAKAIGGAPKGGSFENAENAFQKAIALEPAYVNHRLEYGRLLKDLHKNESARRELEKAIALPPGGSALDARYQSDARALLEKLPR